MLVGKKVKLTEIERDSLEKIRGWRNDPENRQYFRAFKDISSDMQEQWYKKMGNNSDPNHVYFQIMHGNELAGVCNLSYIDWHMRSAEAAIMIGDFKGQGLGTDALEVMCRYGFEEVNLHKIWCEIFDSNPASLAIFKKLGFVQDGMLRDNWFYNGKYGDSYRLSLLEDEWRARNGKV